MNRFLSVLLTITDDLILYFRPSNRRGLIPVLLIVAANSVPAAGVIFLNWNPYMILLIYWGESLIIGILNLLKMMISGTVQNRRFSPEGFARAAGLSVFFTFHYGMFMFVHCIFLLLFMSMAEVTGSPGSSFTIDPFSIAESFIPERLTLFDFVNSEISAISALLISHISSFYTYFIKTGEYNSTEASDYMMRPYKRIIIMQVTIIFGAFALFISGFKSAVFVIIWIGLKIITDLKMHISEIKKPVKTESSLKH